MIDRRNSEVLWVLKEIGRNCSLALGG